MSTKDIHENREPAPPLGLGSRDGLGHTPSWWRCDTHGPGKLSAWGCPECVREMRGEVQTLRDRVTVLNLALMAARGGFALAYDAAEKGLNDEVLLHCWHHGAQADKVLGA